MNDKKKMTNAVAAVSRAIKSGKLKRQPCIMCSKKTGDLSLGHHEDYDQKLNVVWLCTSHHVRLHIFKRLDPNRHIVDNLNLIKKQEAKMFGKPYQPLHRPGAL